MAPGTADIKHGLNDYMVLLVLAVYFSGSPLGELPALHQYFRGFLHRVPSGLMQGRLPLVLLGFSIAYFVAARIGIATSLPPEGIVILWPPNAVVLFVLLQLERDKWPAVMLVTIATEIVADVPEYPLWAAAGYGIVNFTEAALAAILLSRVARVDLPLRRLRDFLIFVAVGPVFASSLAALGGAAIYKAGSPELDYLHYWHVFWFGDATGLLIVGTSLSCLLRRPRWRADLPRIAEALAIAAGLGAASAWAFFNGASAPVIYLVFPMLIWAALRFGSHGAAVSLLITVSCAIVAARAGVGPFAGISHIGTVPYLQGLIAVAGLSIFVLAFSIEDLWRRTDELREEARQHAATRQKVQDAYARLENYNEKLDREVEQRTAELQSVLQQNEFLLREQYHRVKNNLQMLAALVSGQARETTAEELGEKLRAQISAIAATYDVLHRLEASDRVDFCQVMAELCREFRRLSDGTLAFEVEPGACCMLPAEDAIRLGLAVNELITNAAKHAGSESEPGAVRVGCLRQDGQMLVRISDDGPGFPPDFDPSTSNRFGLRMVGMMVAQAGGNLTFGNSPRGSVVEIRIPLPAESPDRPVGADA